MKCDRCRKYMRIPFEIINREKPEKPKKYGLTRKTRHFRGKIMSTAKSLVISPILDLINMVVPIKDRELVCKPCWKKWFLKKQNEPK